MGLVTIIVFLGVGVGPMVALAQDEVTLTVTVETPEGEPVSGASLTATWSGGSSTATTAANGKAFIDVEAGADVTIQVAHPDYTRNHPVTVEDAEERTVDIVVHPKATARLTVRDGQGPVAGVLVSFRKDGNLAVRATTGGTGVVTVGPLEAGEYTVSLRKSRYLTKSVTLNLSGDTVAEIPIKQGSLTLTFNVTDTHYSPPRPIEAVTIEVTDVGSVQTQANGIQQISVPVNTQLTVRISKPGYQPVEQTISVGEADRRVRVSLRRVPALSIAAVNERVVVGESVLVEVTNEYGEPVAGAEIRIDGTAVATTDDDGRATVPIDSVGPHELVAAAEGLTSEPATVRGIQPGGTEPSPSPTPTSAPGLHGFGAALAAIGVVLAVLIGRYGRG